MTPAWRGVQTGDSWSMECSFFDKTTTYRRASQRKLEVAPHYQNTKLPVVINYKRPHPTPNESDKYIRSSRMYKNFHTKIHTLQVFTMRITGSRSLPLNFSRVYSGNKIYKVFTFGSLPSAGAEFTVKVRLILVGQHLSTLISIIFIILIY